jgi:serine/threonine-protein phosphatase 2A regulatory subunit B'
MEMDQQLFEECQKKWEEEESKSEEMEANRQQVWRKVEELAQRAH